ncbi:MAG: hypothetical protein JWN30_1870 [Bacilli bacterium]|nr:hypothetical protein [Bacilli bacterium]
MLNKAEGLKENGIAIGIVGPELIVNKILATIQRFPSFEPVARTYDNDEEAPTLALQLMDSVEVLLFSGPLPYRKAKEKLHFPIPVLFVPLTGTGLYRSLFRIEKSYGLHSLSIDTMPQKTVEKTFRELSQLEVDVVYYNGTRPYSSEELVKFHVGKFNQGLCTVALTGNKSVSEELAALGIPNEWVVPTEQDMIVTLERALLSTESRRSKESQIVVGLVNVDEFSHLIGSRFTEHDVQKMKLDIHRMLLGYVETLDGHLTHLGGDEYLFITTRGIFERETGGYKYIALARDAEKTFGVTFSIGIGFGSSANEAGTHCRLALRHAKEAGGNHCFIVREDKGVIGPLEMTRPLEYDASLLDAEIIKKAEVAGMTIPYLSKIVSQVARKGKTEYTAQELASILGVSIRSTHRFLLQWHDTGLVEIIGEEKSQSKGRPKQIYRLSFIHDYKF